MQTRPYGPIVQLTPRRRSLQARVDKTLTDPGPSLEDTNLRHQRTLLRPSASVSVAAARDWPLTAFDKWLMELYRFSTAAKPVQPHLKLAGPGLQKQLPLINKIAEHLVESVTKEENRENLVAAPIAFKDPKLAVKRRSVRVRAPFCASTHAA